MIYIQKLPSKVTKLGQIETVNARLYKHSINNNPLNRYDMYQTLEGYLNTLLQNKTKAPLNLPKIRGTLQKVLSGTITDDKYRRCLKLCLRDSELFCKTFVHLYATRAHFNVFSDLIVPMNLYVNQQAKSLITELGGIFVMQDCGYVYLLNPVKEGRIPYVTIW